jgi:hypothetical protein
VAWPFPVPALQVLAGDAASGKVGSLCGSESICSRGDHERPPQVDGLSPRKTRERAIRFPVLRLREQRRLNGEGAVFGVDLGDATRVLLGAVLALPCPLSSQSTGGSVAPRMSLGDVCQVIGGAAALGFGIWHFTVPELYHWRSYVPDAPESLVQAVDATNLFFSFSLCLIGDTNIVMLPITSPAEPVSRYWLWANVGLWTARVIYQLVKPQRSHDPTLQWGMAAAFTLTDALFTVSAPDATFGG